MTDVGFVYVELTAEQNEASAAYVTKATMDAGDFDAGGIYWLNITAWVGGNDPSVIFGFQLQLGGVDLEHTEMLVEPYDSDSGILTQYTFRRRITQNSPADDITFQMKGDGVASATAVSIEMEALRLDVDLEEGVDYHYAEDANNTPLTTSPVAFASVAFTPDDDEDKWAVFYSERINIDITSLSLHARHEFLSDAVSQSTQPENIREGEDVAEILCLSAERGYQLNNTQEHTFRVTLEDDSATGSHNDHLFSSVFVLRIAGASGPKTFSHGDFVYTPAEIAPTGAFATVATLSIEPDNTGVFFVSGCLVMDMDSDTRTAQMRLRFDGVVHPTGIDSWSQQMFDSGDRPTFNTFAMKSLSAGASRPLDLQVLVSSSGGPVEDRTLIAHSVELVPSAPAPADNCSLPTFGQIEFNSADEENRPRFGQRIVRGTEE